MPSKKTSTTMTPTTLLLIVVAILVLAYIIVTATAAPGPADTPKQEEIESSSDLNGAIDSLESINVDAVDSGLDELSNEIRQY